MKKIIIIFVLLLFSSNAFAKHYFYTSTGAGLVIVSFTNDKKTNIDNKNQISHETTPPQFSVQGSIGYRKFFGDKTDYFYDIELSGQYDSFKIRSIDTHGYSLSAYANGFIGRYIADRVLARIGAGMGVGMWTVPGGILYEQDDINSYDLAFRAAAGIEYEMNKEINLYTEFNIALLPGYNEVIPTRSYSISKYAVNGVFTNSVIFGVRYRF